MELNKIDLHQTGIEPKLYLSILVAIAKADRFNGDPEKNFVRERARRVDLDFDLFWNTTPKDFSFKGLKVSRQTAMVILRDAIWLASLDGNFSLQEKERVYTYAMQMDIPRSDVEKLFTWIENYDQLLQEWKALLSDS